MKYSVNMTVTGWYWAAVEADSEEEAEAAARKMLQADIRAGMKVRELDNIEFDLEPEISVEEE